MTKLLLACFEDNLGQLLVRRAPSGAPFIIDAVQAAKRQIHHAVFVGRPCDYQVDLVQDPLRTGLSGYVQASGMSECDSGRRNIGIRHLHATIPERVRQGIVDLTGIIPMQSGKAS